MTMFVSKEMIEAVVQAMWSEIIKKGASNKMVSAELIETTVWESGTTFFVPIRHVLSGLIQTGTVRYFKLDNGRLLYGFTQSAQARLKQENPSHAEIASAKEELHHGSELLEGLTADDLPF